MLFGTALWRRALPSDGILGQCVEHRSVRRERRCQVLLHARASRAAMVTSRSLASCGRTPESLGRLSWAGTMTKRVAIIGNAGSGKSFLAHALAAKLGLPEFDLDTIFWVDESYSAKRP